jgi:hypothetical protein
MVPIPEARKKGSEGVFWATFAPVSNGRKGTIFQTFPLQVAPAVFGARRPAGNCAWKEVRTGPKICKKEFSSGVSQPRIQHPGGGVGALKPPPNEERTEPCCYSPPATAAAASRARCVAGCSDPYRITPSIMDGPKRRADWLFTSGVSPRRRAVGANGGADLV